MTPEQVHSADLDTRLRRLEAIRDMFQDGEGSLALADEALLIVLLNIQLSVQEPGDLPVLSGRPFMYLEAIFSEVRVGSFMWALKPRADQWIAWCYEYQDKLLTAERRTQLRALFLTLGLIRNNRV